ncbi:MAG TPA: type 1 glutamine amidotransferase, partial [Burkholderiaceae bacterium]|nr:type 1 glutamine amidotransferase [Burkholderiaceae bacterium]
HCFGAQMMARTLGGRVCANGWANIGWQRTHVVPAASRLFGTSEFIAFNWHYETFEIPSGAQRLLFGHHCLNKGFALGKHLAFQCHLEVTQSIVREWCRASCAELAAASGPAVQREEQILLQLDRHLPRLHQISRRVYTHWASQLKRPPAVHCHARSGAPA